MNTNYINAFDVNLDGETKLKGDTKQNMQVVSTIIYLRFSIEKRFVVSVLIDIDRYGIAPGTSRMALLSTRTKQSRLWPFEKASSVLTPNAPSLRCRYFPLRFDRPFQKSHRRMLRSNREIQHKDRHWYCGMKIQWFLNSMESFMFSPVLVAAGLVYECVKPARDLASRK
jgi:hypothetical protein